MSAIKNQKMQYSLTAMASLLLISSCGGGGGSSPPPPPPPPPPAAPNQAPTLTVELETLLIDENTKFYVDLSKSTDPDGQITRVDINQPNPFFYSVEPMSVSSNKEGRFEFTAPEVLFYPRRNEPASDRARVILDIEIEDNDGSVVSERIELEILNVKGATKSEGINEFYSYNLNEEVILLPTVASVSFSPILASRPITTAPNGEEQILLLDGMNIPGSTRLEIEAQVLPDTVPELGPVFPEVFNFDLDPGTRQQFAIANTNQNKIFWYAAFDPSQTLDYVKDVTIDIQAPCHLEGRVSSNQDIAWVGQRNAGVSVIRLIPNRLANLLHDGFDTEIISNAEPSRSLCFIYPTDLPTTIPGTPPISQFSDLIAIDFDTNELVLLADYNQPAGEYEFISAIPIETDGLSNLNIVAVQATGTPSQRPNVIWIVMSDGLDNGEHRLVLVWQEANGQIFQKTHEFEGSAPSAMHVTKFFPTPEDRLVDAGADVVIVSNNSSQVVVFEDEGITQRPTFDMIPVFEPPVYFDIGSPPSSSAIVQLPTINAARDSGFGIAFTYEGSKEVKVFTYTD